jgi:hypothetical protein
MTQGPINPTTRPSGSALACEEQGRGGQRPATSHGATAAGRDGAWPAAAVRGGNRRLAMSCIGHGRRSTTRGDVELNPNNLNCRSIQVSRFEFSLDKFIIQSSVSVLVVYNLNRPNNPNFNIVAYFD